MALSVVGSARRFDIQSSFFTKKTLLSELRPSFTSDLLEGVNIPDLDSRIKVYPFKQPFQVHTMISGDVSRTGSVPQIERRVVEQDTSITMSHSVKEGNLPFLDQHLMR